MSTSTAAIERHLWAYINRPKAQPRAHTAPCANCPSAHYPMDPQVAEVATWPHDLRVRTAFPCGWAPRRYCKGYCDQMGIKDSDLAEMLMAEEKEVAP